ncbi:LOW QUALITY PROTEIN: 39S ribosomal protein L20, mitochondrial [Hermetia illucens]|uniref:LOW QUALITY PROTEIN: 39S ribosomal protein L20, mitochondrial n=1 Tax=Hermetia illucens TaxID=343691 RepID=UPI0018CC3123|nr:LOW QUALITY PROTEIN: 39S ribosomal protein L20, mitochondrial [Hermetia illucens]
MVFTSLVNYVRTRGPDEFWRKRKISNLDALILTIPFQHFRGRRRNCYSIAIRNVHRALVYATKGRRLKKQDLSALWKIRTQAACEQYNISLENFQEGLTRSNILLNKKILSDLAIWEPRTFEALAKIARERAAMEGYGTLREQSVVNKVFGMHLLLKP